VSREVAATTPPISNNLTEFYLLSANIFEKNRSLL